MLQLIQVDSIPVDISFFISAYRESYNTQHVMLRLSEEWRENLDKNYIEKKVIWFSREKGAN